MLVKASTYIVRNKLHYVVLSVNIKWRLKTHNLSRLFIADTVREDLRGFIEIATFCMNTLTLMPCS